VSSKILGCFPKHITADPFEYVHEDVESRVGFHDLRHRLLNELFKTREILAISGS
jgi:hypothetical protein